MITTTFGVGELILDAVTNRCCKEIVVLIGGSATNDAGVGMLQALGFRFFDSTNQEIAEKGGQILEKIERIDLSNVVPQLRNLGFKSGNNPKNELNDSIFFTVACDVTNVFTGPTGATHVFSAQKGATPEIMSKLELGMIKFHELVKKMVGIDLNLVRGTGAAGGIGGCLYAFLNASLVPGVELVLNTIKFERLIEGCDLIITGEGKLDNQTFMGKVPVGVLKRAKKKNVPVIAVVGMVDIENDKIIYENEDVTVDDFLAILPVVNGPISLENAMDEKVVRKNIHRTLLQILKIIKHFGFK